MQIKRLPVMLGAVVIAVGLASGDASALGRASKKADVTIEVVGSRTDNPSTLGQPVTFLAFLTVEWNPDENGTVTFFDGTKPLGTQSLLPYLSPPCVEGLPCFDTVAVLTTSALSLGVHDITAVYSGDASNNPATSKVFVQVVSSAPIPVTGRAAMAVLFLGCALSGIWLLRSIDS